MRVMRDVIILWSLIDKNVILESTLCINRRFVPQIQDSLSFSRKSGTNPGIKHTTTDIRPCYLHYLSKSSIETQYNIDISGGPIKMGIKLIDLYRFPPSPHI